MALDNSAIVIEPEPPLANYSSTSVDLTLDATLSVFHDELQGVEVVLDPSLAGFSHDAVLGELSRPEVIVENGWVFNPGQLILAWTVERVELPISGKLAARVEGKSSLARLGISIHLTAPTIHAGFVVKSDWR